MPAILTLPRKTAAALCLAALTLSACGGGSTAPQTVSASRTIGSSFDDTSIQLGLNRDLNRAFPTFFTQMGTEVREGRVLLVGTVATPEQRLEASKVAWQIRGVRDVVNELQVANRQSAANYLSDARISNQMRLRLLTATNVGATNFDIETVNGTVYILGIAKDKAELEHVAYLAATISGVQKVVSHALLADDPRRMGRPKHASATTYE